MSYNAVICKIFVRPVPGLDNLVLGTCLGYNVLVSKEQKDGELGCYFEAGGQLSDVFCRVNNLYRIKNADGTSTGGMFEENRRVKVIKLRGIKSEGFWIPVSSVAFTGHSLDKLKEGDAFDSLNDIPICCKYETPSQRKGGGNQNVGIKVRKNNVMFLKHVDTEQFKRLGANIPIGSIIYISLKMHGTSQRTGMVLDEIPYSMWETFMMRVYGLFNKQYSHRIGWTKLNGTKNTVIEKRAGDGFHGKEGFRLTMSDKINPKKGELFFYEVVGYTESGAPIMQTQDTSILKSKAFTKKYGQTMVYKYGCLEGECDTYVYRIATVNEDGQLTDYSWPQVVRRCTELGLKTVPPLIPPFIYDGDFDKLKQTVTELVEGKTLDEVLMSDPVDSTVVREGIVVRYEHETGFGWLKQKSFAFLAMEGLQRDNPFFVDLEEIS